MDMFFLRGFLSRPISNISFDFMHDGNFPPLSQQYREKQISSHFRFMLLIWLRSCGLFFRRKQHKNNRVPLLLFARHSI